MADPRQILVIDDDDGIREVAHASLELVGGHGVTTTGSGEEGLDISRRSPPDVILLDVMMPGLDGPATFARLQESAATRDIPVLLLTAKTQESAAGGSPSSASRASSPSPSTRWPCLDRWQKSWAGTREHAGSASRER